MKYIIYLVLIPFTAFGQLTANQQEILHLNLKRITKEYPNRFKKLGDTLLIYSTVELPYETLAELKKEIIANGEFTTQEADDIFGNDSIPKFYSSQIKEWRNDNFSGYHVKLIKNENKGINLSEQTSYRHFISEPLIRNDNKYALMFHTVSNQGGYLNIFVYKDNKWYYFTTIELFII